MIILKLLLALLFVIPESLRAQTSPPLSLNEGYVFLPLKGSTITAGYGVITNHTNEDVQLQLISAEGFKAAELHETKTTGGMMKMQKVTNLLIPKGAVLDLKPGGSHIMLFEPNKELKVGDFVKVHFKFKDQTVVLDFPIKSRTEP